MTLAPALADWSNFFVAEVGAAAALSGLLAVAISINLARILAFPSLPARAGEALVLLVGAMVVASLGLVPGQPGWLLGAELLALGGVMAATSICIVARASATISRADRAHRLYFRITLSLSASLPIVAGGVWLILSGPGGLYCVMAGELLLLVAGVLHAWVLLVEIMR